MNGVLCMTNLLLDTKLNPEQLEYTTLIKSTAHIRRGQLHPQAFFQNRSWEALNWNPLEFNLRDSLAPIMKTS